MKSNYPYRATPMGKINIQALLTPKDDSAGVASTGGQTNPSTIPSKSTFSGMMIDGPYGGKKPQSSR